MQVEEIIIAKAGKPAARLVPFSSAIPDLFDRILIRSRWREIDICHPERSEGSSAKGNDPSLREGWQLNKSISRQRII